MSPRSRRPPPGFLRLLNRALDLPMRQHAVDLFAQAQHYLTERSASDGPHPLLVLDDAEGLQPELLDILRRLTAYDLDAEDRFSVLISGTEELLRTLRHPSLQPLCTRVSYANSLQGFTLADTRNYVAVVTPALQWGGHMSPAAWEALIPRTWSGRKAVTRLLEVVRDAIWALHGEQMLEELAMMDRPPVYAEPFPRREDCWDDIPFCAAS